MPCLNLAPADGNAGVPTARNPPGIAEKEPIFIPSVYVV